MIKAVAIVAMAAQSCQPTAVAPNQPVEERPAQVIWVPEGYPWTFNAESGDTVNLIMMTDDPGAALERCENSGGTFVINHYTDIYECHDVDF